MKNLRIEDLSTEQKNGMLLCARSFNYADGDDLEFTLELIRNHALGCVQVPYKKPDVIKKIRDAADYPILMIMDMEMGFPTSEMPPVPMMTLAACDKPEYYRAFAKAVVADATAAGCNGTWGPVIDVLSGDGPCKVYRTFSDDHEHVARAAEQIAQVFADNGFISCGKHYPGGSHERDSHMANTGSFETKEELMARALPPYKYLMDRGLLPTIMVGHSIFHNIDPEYPASLSKKVIDIIREMGFDGVCYSDSFGMMAILQQYGEDKIYGMAVAAGNDIVLPNYRTSMRRNYEMLMNNYRDGAFTEERLNEAVRRVLAAQAIVGAQPKNPTPFTELDRETYYNIARDCITAVTDPGLDAALPADNKDRLFVLVTDEGASGDELAQEMVTRSWYHPDAIEKKIRQEFPEAEVVTLPEFPTAKANERVLLAATRHKEVVCVTFCNTRPYLGTDCLTRRVEAVINALAMSGKVSAILHFGNPYALKTLDHLPRKLFGYMMPESQLYAIEVLSGKIPARGKLPYNVEFH